MRSIVTLALIAAPALGHATTYKVVCENWRREYVVKFDDAFNDFHADTTRYKVLAVEKTDKKFVVVGLTVNGGLTFRAHFRPYKKMEFFSADQLSQTDGCR